MLTSRGEVLDQTKPLSIISSAFTFFISPLKVAELDVTLLTDVVTIGKAKKLEIIGGGNGKPLPEKIHQ